MFDKKDVNTKCLSDQDLLALPSLSEESRSQMWDHLADCPHCQHRLAWPSDAYSFPGRSLNAKTLNRMGFPHPRTTQTWISWVAAAVLLVGVLVFQFHQNIVVFPSQQTLALNESYQVKFSEEQIVLPQKTWIWAQAGSQLTPKTYQSLYLEAGNLVIKTEEPVLVETQEGKIRLTPGNYEISRGDNFMKEKWKIMASLSVVTGTWLASLDGQAAIVSQGNEGQSQGISAGQQAWMSGAKFSKGNLKRKQMDEEELVNATHLSHSNSNDQIITYTFSDEDVALLTRVKEEAHKTEREVEEDFETRQRDRILKQATFSALGTNYRKEGLDPEMESAIFINQLQAAKIESEYEIAEDPDDPNNYSRSMYYNFFTAQNHTGLYSSEAVQFANHTDKVINLITQSSDFDPSKKDHRLANAYHNKGLLHYYPRELNKAIEQFSLAIKYYSDLHVTYNFKASCLMMLGKLDSAEDFLNNSLEVFSRKTVKGETNFYKTQAETLLKDLYAVKKYLEAFGYPSFLTQIKNITPDSQAELIGLEKGDIIISIDGLYSSSLWIASANLKAVADRKAPILCLRNGVEFTVFLEGGVFGAELEPVVLPPAPDPGE